MTEPSLSERPNFDWAANDQFLLARSLERRRLQCYLALLFGDTLAIISGFAICSYLYIGNQAWSEFWMEGRVLLPMYIVLALYNRSYSIEALRSAWSGCVRAMTALMLSLTGVVLVVFAAKAGEQFSRVILATGTVCAAVLLVWVRLQMRGFIRWRLGSIVTNDLIIDDGGPRLNMDGSIYVSAAALNLRPDSNDPRALDRLGNVLRNIDRVTVSCPPDRCEDWALILKGANVDGEVIDDAVAQLGALGARVVGDHGLLQISSGPLDLRQRAIKRLLDVTVAGSALIALFPLFIVIALMIKLEDGGPVLFVQRRMGRGNRFFGVYKFRSMSVAHADH